MADADTPENPPTDKVSGIAWATILLVLAVMALVALHLNWIRWQRDKIEKVIVTPIATPTPSP